MNPVTSLLNKLSLVVIPLSQSRMTVIDKCDYEKVSQYKWFAKNCGYGRYRYAFTNIKRPNGKWYSLSLARFLMDATDPNVYVDHRDSVTLNNTRENLRFATPAQNMQNRKTGNNSSGYRGVSWNVRDKMWFSILIVNGKKIYIGCGKDPKVLSEKYKAMAKQLQGEFYKEVK